MSTVEIGITGISERLLSVSIDYHGAAAPLIRKWDVDRVVVDALAREIAQVIEEALAEPPAGAEAVERATEIGDRLRSCGLALFQEILKEEGDGLRALARKTSSPTYVIFKLDKSLAYLPLEVMNDGDNFLSHRFAVGRVIYAEVAETRETPSLGLPNVAVLIGDPSGDAAIAQDVEREIDSVRDIFRSRSDWRLKIALGADATLEHILQNLPRAVVFHFSGHGVVAQDERGTGLKLGSGEILDGYSLQGLHQAPVCAFLNVCTASSAQSWRGPLGVIEVLLRRGTRACIASLWDVGSRTAIGVASRFYEHLLDGETFGEALRLARRKAAEATGIHDPTWAAYTLYGDPRFTLSGEIEDASLIGPSWRGTRGRNLARNLGVLAVMGAALAIVGIFIVRPAVRLQPAATDSTSADTLVIYEQAEPVAKPQVGYLVIESNPTNAIIFVDGKRIGITPYAAELPVGVHRVVLEKSGFKSWAVSARIKVSSRTPLNVSLEKVK